MAPQRDAASRITEPPSTKRRAEVTRRMTDGLSPGDRSLLLDLAYEEYCQREEKGEQVNLDEFCRAYPGLQHSLARMIEVHVALRSTSIGNEPAVEPKWPQVNETWLGWKLLEPLGRGAFSRVFLAIEPELGEREVVVKCTPAGAEEAYILGKLNHPNIVPILSVKKDPESGLTGICMPYLGRRTLADGLNELLAERAAPRFRFFGNWSAKTSRLTQVLPLIEKIARALAAAHGKEILHGDIKPSNILISFDDEPLLADFNLSRNLAADAGRLGGTPPYMAPEVLCALLRGPFGSQEEILTAAADQYSLAIVAYELLTGDLPYKVQLETLGKLPFDQWPQHFGLPPCAKSDIDWRMYEILARATAFEPAKRFDSVKEFADQLSSLLRARVIRRRTGMITAAVLGVVFVLGSGAVGISRMLPPPLPEPDDNSPIAILERAIRMIRDNQYLNAGQQLDQLALIAPSNTTEEWAAYCFARSREWQRANGYYRRLRDNGLDHPAIDNNIGLCEHQSGNYENAEVAFTRAIERDNKLYAAYHGRAAARFSLAGGLRCPPPGVWEDYRKAIDIGPASAQLYREAATILARVEYRGCAPINADLKSCVREALALGEGIDFFEQNADFGHLDLTTIKSEAAAMKRKPNVEAVLLLPPISSLRDEITRLKSLPVK